MCARVCVVCVAVCVVLALLLCIILYYLKGMYNCVYVFVLYCIIVLYYCYITVLHYMRCLHFYKVYLQIWALQIPFWLMTDWLVDRLIDWTWNSCQLEQTQGLVTAIPVNQHSFHWDLADPSLGQNYPPVLFQTVTAMRNEDSVLGENHPSDGCSSQSPLFSLRIETSENYPPVLFQIITTMKKWGFNPWWKSP